jgi:LysM repeat protein
MIRAIIIVFLCLAIFGTAGYFGYELFVKPKQVVRQQVAQATPTPAPDPSLPDFQRAQQLWQENKLVEAREAFERFLQMHPYSSKLDEAREALGEINADIFFSAAPGPDKQEYIVKKGDVLVRIAKKTGTSAELIMRANNLDGTLLQIDDRLIIPEADFSLVINRQDQAVTLSNKGKFFKKYKAKEWTAPPARGSAAASGKITEKIAWREGERVAFGSEEYAGSTRWIMTNIPGYALYTVPDEQPDEKKIPPPPGIGLGAEQMEELSALLNRNVPITIE